jgi:YegS/Rv2252/BmrU family lipid kinase
MKHLFIVNPVAGGRDSTAEVTARVKAAFAGGRPGDYEVYTTKAPMDACDKIIAEAASGAELRVYACGGDGTLNECVCGAAGRGNVAVTHYPCGTGNDFVRCFGTERDRFRDLEALLDGEVRALDVIDCNGRYAINICSVGIDARIGTDVHKYSALPVLGGKLAYGTSAAVNLVKGVRQPLRVVCGGKLYYGDMSLICACNGSYYGGGFHPVPEARPDDGVLDFLIVKGVSRLAFVRLVGAYAKGKYAEMPKVITHVRGERIEIESETPLAVNLDGELIFGKTVTMQLVPGGVNFLVPRDMAFFRAAAEAD